MTVHTWEDALAKGDRLYGESPPLGSELEKNLILEWQKDPAEFEVVLADVHDDWKAGKISKAWPIVLWRIREHNKAEALRNREIDTSVPLEKRLRLAESWIRNAGLYEPNEESLIDALFGQHGSLRAWADDLVIRQRMIDLWQKEHPRGLKADKELEVRAGKVRAYLDKMAMAKVARDDAAKAAELAEPAPSS